MESKITLTVICFTIIVLAGCKSSRLNTLPAQQPGMYKVTILYPNGDGKTLNFDYYAQKHMPMVAGFIGQNLVFYEIDKGISGSKANDKPTYMAIGHFYVKDIAEYNKAIGQHIDAIISDFKNYTNVQPIVQVNEIKEVVHNASN